MNVFSLFDSIGLIFPTLSGLSIVLVDGTGLLARCLMLFDLELFRFELPKKCAIVYNTSTLFQINTGSIIDY